MNAEYNAVVEGQGLIVRSDRGALVLTGADRLSFLHALLTNDIATLASGQGCYAAYLTPQGRMITDMVVLNDGDRVLLDVPIEVAPGLATRLDQLIFSEDVRVVDLSGTLGQLSIHGPAALATVARVFGGDPGFVREHNNVRRTLLADIAGEQASSSTLIARTDETGGTGVAIYTEAADREKVGGALMSAGAILISAATLDTLRIEAGRPRFHADMNEETIPLEAGIEDRAISFTKGCYVGQEVIIRVLHRGHGRVARRLVGISIPEGPAPEHGDRLWRDDEQVGRITSGAFSPRLGHAIGLGYVTRDLAVPGTAIEVEHGDRHWTASVVAVPFVRTSTSMTAPA